MTNRRGSAVGTLAVASMISALGVSLAVPTAQAAVVDSGTDTWSDTYDLVCDQGTKTKKDDFVEHVTETGTLEYTIRVRGGL